MISIIIPVYNGKNYIERCFKSIFAQTEQDYEIIAVDDGSKDSSLEILQSYKKENIKIIHTENHGVCHARNTGLNEANGEYVTFVDVDDELRTDALELMLNLSKKHDSDITALSKIYLKEDGTVKHPHPDSTHTEVWEDLTPLQKHAEDHISGHSVYAKLYKKEIVETVRFEEGKSINEDSFFAFQCFAKAKKMVFQNVGIYKYYETSNSASRASFSEKFFDILYFANKKADIIKNQYPELEKYIPQIIMRANISMLLNLCKTYDKKYVPIEKKCIKTIKSLKSSFVPVFPHEKKILKIIKYHLFPLYKLYLYKRYNFGSK